MLEHINELADEIVNPIKKAEENLAKNCHLGYGFYTSPWWRKPAWKRLSKDKGIGGVLFRIKEHPHEKRKSISNALKIGEGTCGEYVQTLLKAEMITWTRKNHYEITPLGVAMLKLFNLV